MSETKSAASANAASTKSWRPETRLIHSGALRSQFNETSEALFLTQGFLYDTAEQCEARFKGEDPGFIYSRFSNPNISMFESRMCALEGAEAARATATGMAAVTTAILAPLRSGDHVVAAKAMFGSCRFVIEDLLPRYGISSTLVDGLDLDQWQKAMQPNTRTCFLESPTNPTLDVLDISAIAEIAHKGGARLIVDNVFATPIWQSRSRSAPTSWCIRRPSTSTVRAAASAASSCRRTISSRSTSTTTCARPARRFRHSMRGRW